MAETRISSELSNYQFSLCRHHLDSTLELLLICLEWLNLRK